EGESLPDCEGLSIRFSGFFRFGQSDLNVADVVMGPRQIPLEIDTPRVRLHQSQLDLECSPVRLGSLGQSVQLPLVGAKLIVAECQFARMVSGRRLVEDQL